MTNLSIIVPARNETYEVTPGLTVLQRTLQDLYEKATGDFEVIVVFDGPPLQDLPTYPNLRIIYYPTVIGLKPALNEVIQGAAGKYVMKVDAHCMFSPGFDEALLASAQENWLIVPRVYTLDAENWKWQDGVPYDYFYLGCPLTDKRFYRFAVTRYWNARNQERANVGPLDETLDIHGSCWLISRNHYLNNIGGLSSEGYTKIWFENLELGLKTWLGPWDGRVMVNKDVWVAHMHKGEQRPRGFRISFQANRAAYEWSAHHWMENRWMERAHDLEWLIDRFWPVPSWPDNWKTLAYGEGSYS